MSADAFDLRRLIRQVREESGSVDPGEIAGKVLAQTPDESLRDAYETTLRDYVRRVIIGSRAAVSGTAGNPSAKVAGIRDWWRGMLDEPVHVADGWLSLGACTRDDLLFACAERRKIAAQNMAWATRYEKLAKAMATAKAATVADLPADLLARELAESAA